MDPVTTKLLVLAGAHQRRRRAPAALPARLAGSRCQDAEVALIVTTLEGPDHWYTLSGSLQTAVAPAGAYDRVLASFRLS